MREFFDAEVGTAALPDTRVRDAAGAMTRSTDETTLALADAIEPVWEKAEVWENDLSVATEVPAKLKKAVDYTVLVEKSGRQVSLTTQKPSVRVLAVEPRDGSKAYCLIATFLPDEGWNGHVEELAVGGKTGDFSGLLVYSLPDGTSPLGWRYDGGQASHIVLFNDDYASLQDPDITVGLGFGVGSTTRADGSYEDPFVIGNAVCVGVRKNDDTMQSIFYDEMEGGGAGLDDSINDFLNGGGGNRFGDAPISPNAKGLFKGSLTEQQWKKLEAMINEILADCMGGTLYNALVELGTQYGISFHSGTANSNYDGSVISLSTLADNSSLLHELFHAWQLYQETPASRDASTANRELEAYLAQYRFAGELPVGDYKNNIESLSRYYISPNGALMTPADDLAIPFNELYKNTIDLITKQYGMYGGRNIQFDPNRSFNQNFQNLRYLSNNC